jgi:hypothetical protein
MDNVERLWTHEETARFLHVSAWTLHHLVGQAAGPTVYRVGRNRRYDPAQVRSWLHLSTAGLKAVEPEGGRHVRAATDDESARTVSVSTSQSIAIDPEQVAR